MLKVQNTDKSKKDIVIADGQASTQSQKGESRISPFKCMELHASPKFLLRIENVDSNVDNDDMTVEEYLELRCQQMVQVSIHIKTINLPYLRVTFSLFK